MRGDRFFVEMAARPPFTRLHPKVAAFFKDYLSREKAVRFGDQWVVNTNFPPYPSRAFDRFAAGFDVAGSSTERRLHSVTLAVTNRCSYKCWHCYNAGRSPRDLSVTRLSRLAEELERLGAVCVTLTGGEPLIRCDLEELARPFGERFCVILGTTGSGLTRERARSLAVAGVFAAGLSLDSLDEAEHDRLRGTPGAFQTALTGLRLCREAGLYSYVVAVASPGLLERERFFDFMRFCGDAGAYEVHLLEPCPVGRLQGCPEAVLTARDSDRILEYQAEVAADESLPILSAFAYVEAAEAFGCGAGLTHLYIDGAGEVSPCNFVPLSFGNLLETPLPEILERMGRHFKLPRPSCIGKVLGPNLPETGLPLPAEASEALCEKLLAKEHPIPRFFRIRAEAVETAGAKELVEAYDAIHADYDAHWLSSAGRPIEELVARLAWKGDERVFEAGCGTGYGTALLAARLTAGGSLLAADLSSEMLSLARRRLTCFAGQGTALEAGPYLPGLKAGLAARPEVPVHFEHGDALALLARGGPFDLVFTSWVLGYIPIAPFFAAAAAALAPGGRLAFVVHRENSPARELGIFYRLAAEDPGMIERKVAFDFPAKERVVAELAAARLDLLDLWEGAAVFRYPTPRAVLDHLLKSGAGTAFYNAVEARCRDRLTEQFLRLLEESNEGAADYAVSHDFVGCIARKAEGCASRQPLPA